MLKADRSPTRCRASRRRAPRHRAACAAALAAAILVAPAGAAAALPTVSVKVATSPLADNGAHRGTTVTAQCAAGTRLVGGGGYVRTVADPSAPGAVLPTNGLVLGGTAPSTAAAPVDLPVADGTVDPRSWLSIANFTGVSEAGDQASAYALCTTASGPSHTVVAVRQTVGANAAQEAQAPTLTTATCPAGTRLIGGGAATNTPDQVNDGVTVGNNGNLKPLGDYPSDATGAPAADGSSAATSWTAFGSAGLTSTGDTVTSFALCSSDAATTPVRVARVDVDGPDAQPGTTTTAASASCPAGTRMLGGGYSVDETVAGTGARLQPQQGYHMRGSYPSMGTGAPPGAVGDAAVNPGAWTALVQAGGQNLAPGKHMTTRSFALCATPPLAFASVPPKPARYGGSYVLATSGGTGDPVTFSVAGASAAVCALAADGVTVRFIGVGTCSLSADQATGGHATQSVSIMPAPLTVVGPVASKIYGDPVPALTPTYRGLVNGDTAPATAPTCSTTAGALSPVGTYPTTCSGAADPHYTITSTAGKLTVKPRTLTITSSGSVAYGAPIPVLTPSYGGLVGGATAPATPATCTTTATSGSPVGSYKITCSGAADPNYTPKYVAGTLKIVKAATSLQALALSDTAQHPTAVLTRTDSGAAISGQTVKFKAGSASLCSAVTDAGGRAQCTAVVFGGPAFTATYAGSTNFLASST